MLDILAILVIIYIASRIKASQDRARRQEQKKAAQKAQAQKPKRVDNWDWGSSPLRGNDLDQREQDLNRREADLATWEDSLKRMEESLASRGQEASSAQEARGGKKVRQAAQSLAQDPEFQDLNKRVRQLQTQLDDLAWRAKDRARRQDPYEMRSLSSEEDGDRLVEGIIMSEILGPPVSMKEDRF